MTLAQDADAIIASEGIDNTTLANEEPVATDDATDDKGDDQQDDTTTVDDGEDKDEKSTSDDDDTTATDGGDKDDTTDADKQDGNDEKTVSPESTPNVEPDGKSATETVTEARSLIENLQLTEDRIFNEDGSVKPWSEVVPAGAYLAAQLEPVKVTDKDGKEHEFMLISDVEKAFPNGFEANNNLAQLKFEKAIMANESKFDDAVKDYNQAQEQYTKETNAVVQARSDNERINKEYRAMADQGLVPKVEGDPNDPKFLEQAAVKELDKILNWMEATNKTNQEKGLGQIQSLYVAKQLMDSEGIKVTKEDKAKEIDADRKEVASLSATPAPAGDDKSKVASQPSTNMATFAEQIISQENLR